MDDKLDTIKKDLNEEIKLNEVEELIKSNVTSFDYNGKTYRIRPLTYKDRSIGYEKKVEKYTELLSNSKYKLEADLKKAYKETRGIDIDEMQTRYMALELQKSTFMEELGKLVKDNGPQNEKDQLKEKILELKNTQMEISIKKMELLQYSIESQVMIYVYSYLTFLCTETLVDKATNQWKATWTTFEEFQNEKDDKLVNNASFRASLIIGSI